MKGFTLIEVMVALMVLAIAITAIFRVVYEDNHITMILEQKNKAHQVGKYLFNQYQLDYQYRSTPKPLGDFSGTTTQFNRTWFWRSAIHHTENKALLKTEIRIYIDEQQSPITTIRGFLVTS